MKKFKKGDVAILVHPDKVDFCKNWTKLEGLEAGDLLLITCVDAGDIMGVYRGGSGYWFNGKKFINLGPLD